MSEIMRMIGPQTHETRIVGIHGMGGAGKTNLAKIIYNKLLPDFEHRCFLSNIRETSKVKGVEYLQNQLISNIFKLPWKDISISNTDEGIEMIKDRLRGKRLLLLLDDVDRKNQLNALMGKRDWFGEGSKLLITSRNKEVLNLPEVDWTYELNFMDFDKSLRLFSKHAFRRDRPLDDYLAHSRKAVSIAGGLPLALEVIGSLLSCNSKEKWDVILKKLENVPHEEVSSKLKISYEALDDRQKHIFLDIACFFIGCDKEIAIHMWDETEFFPEEALEVLQNMSLIKIEENNTLWMHDQIRDLGREIIRQDSNMVTEKQTRVWYVDGALDLLMTNQEKEKVEALRLQFRHSAEHRFADEDFMRLPNLRFLVVDGGDEYKWMRELNDQKKILELACGVIMRKLRQRFHLPVNFFRKKSHLLQKLRWLSWYNFPLNFDIAKLSMRKLVVLDLAESAITERWDGWSHIKMAKSLKVLDLSGWEELVKTPNFSGLANLERLIMESCTSLVEIDKSIGQLQRLVFLDLSFCLKLCSLPLEIRELKSLQVLRILGRSARHNNFTSNIAVKGFIELGATVLTK
ncbi:disease resistance protein RUN1-like [Syzygium oleosum]|uniref:disease resistance protein RUN1-like n=1 Tax=Syzygium oleosum TaxID=219896 RepID=UPI0024B96F0F|nr:disease resistance protein RUN1-like [Syzygium oleosum]